MSGTMYVEEYKLKINEVLQDVLLPIEARLLTVRKERDGLYLYALVDSVYKSNTRAQRIAIIPTGKCGLDLDQYLGSHQIPGGEISHVFRAPG